MSPSMANPWQHFSLQQIAGASHCPADAIGTHWPRLVAQLEHIAHQHQAEEHTHG